MHILTLGAPPPVCGQSGPFKPSRRLFPSWTAFAMEPTPVPSWMVIPHMGTTGPHPCDPPHAEPPVHLMPATHPLLLSHMLLTHSTLSSSAYLVFPDD